MEGLSEAELRREASKLASLEFTSEAKLLTVRTVTLMVPLAASLWATVWASRSGFLGAQEDRFGLVGVAIGIAIASLCLATVYHAGVLRRQVWGDGQMATGLLAVSKPMDALLRCDPADFSNKQLDLRRTAVVQIGRMASVIERIPSSMRITDLDVVHMAYERAEYMRGLQRRVGLMTTRAEGLDLARELLQVKSLYDSGQWQTLPSVSVSLVPLRRSLGFIAAWTALATASFGGIVAMVVLAAMQKVPQAVATFVPFVLTVTLYAALARLGVAGDAMKQAVEVVSKAQGGLTVKPEEKKDEAKLSTSAESEPHFVG